MNSKKKLRKEMAFRLKKLRTALSLTQEVMARTIETGRANYTRIEVGDIFLSHIFLQKLALEFNVSMEWLICGRGPMFIAGGEDIGVGKNEGMQSLDQDRFGNPTSPEIMGLLEYMGQIPVFYHEVMEFFYKFKVQHKELIEAMDNRTG